MQRDYANWRALDKRTRSERRGRSALPTNPGEEVQFPLDRDDLLAVNQNSMEDLAVTLALLAASAIVVHEATGLCGARHERVRRPSTLVTSLNKATIQILKAFQPVIAQQSHCDIQHRQQLYQQLIKAIASHRVADRRDRFKPRMAKRRPKNYDCLTRPQREIKLEMLKRLSEI